MGRLSGACSILFYISQLIGMAMISLAFGKFAARLVGIEGEVPFWERAFGSGLILGLSALALVGTKVVGQLQRIHGVEAMSVYGDVSREEDIERLFDFAMEKLDALHVLVNNAGILHDKLLVSTSLEEWNEVMAVNLRGVFLATRRAIEEFMAGGEGGRIVNVSSIAANGSAGQASYSASKAGLLSLTRAVAKEYGRRNIACNAVVPGYLETEMTDSFSDEARRARERLSPHRRFGATDEVIEAILYLASSEASYVTGDALYVAGAVRDVPELRS